MCDRARKVSPAERANRITFFLKGDLKNLRVAYLRAGAKLAKIPSRHRSAPLDEGSERSATSRPRCFRRSMLSSIT
jgi:hypothetical protein